MHHIPYLSQLILYRRFFTKTCKPLFKANAVYSARTVLYAQIKTTSISEEISSSKVE